MKPRTKVLVLLLALCADLTFVWWLQDDFYIHLQYARNLLCDHEWAFNRGTPDYGSTSPLWVLTLTAAGALGVDLYWAAKILSVGFGVLTVCVIVNQGALFTGRACFWLCICSVILNHWFRLAAGSGMEATMAALLAVVLAVKLLRPSDGSSNRDQFVYGVLSGLLALCRPEFCVLPLCFCFQRAPTWRTAGLRFAAYLAGCLLTVLPWLIYAQVHFHTIVPNTVVVKSLLVDPIWAVSAQKCIKGLVRVAMFYASTNAIEAAGLAVLLVTALRRPRGPSGARIPVPLYLLLLLIPAAYAVNQVRGGEVISYRYAAPTLPALVLAGWVAVDAMVNRTGKEGVPRWAVVGAAVFLAVSNTFLSVLHTPSLLRSAGYVENVLVESGRWLNKETEPEAVVACHDVGAVAYYSQRRVLDLVGLNSKEVLAGLLERRPDAINSAAIERFRPDYLLTRFGVDIGDYARYRTAGNVIKTFQVPAYRFEPGALLKEPRTFRVELLRLSWRRDHDGSGGAAARREE